MRATAQQLLVIQSVHRHHMPVILHLQGRESIAAKLTANLITEAGADRVLAMDLHSGQCVGYFDIPVDHVYGETVILDYLASKRIATGDLVVVSPDVGGVARARAFAKKLNDAPLAIIDKRRSAHNVSEVMHLIGDVKGKVAVLVDDMIDTAGTITNAGRALLQEGAREVGNGLCSDSFAWVCTTLQSISAPSLPFAVLQHGHVYLWVSALPCDWQMTAAALPVL
jgi:hypothetical protein